MAYLIANIPPIEVFVRKEFLYDFLTDQNGKSLGKDEYESAHWLTVKSIPNQALYFESLIHDYGAVYDEKTISLGLVATLGLYVIQYFCDP